jgi:rfaE bifunctional protein kinase chain/domain
MIGADRCLELLDGLAAVRLAVCGDFFLDEYLVIDPALDEPSLETGLAAWQVVGVRHSPGAAGTVTANLARLEVGAIEAVGAIGDDGNGYSLRQGLQRCGVGMEQLLVLDELFTPTYTKPLMIQPDGDERESHRLDRKNRRPLSEGVQRKIIAGLQKVLPEVDGVIVVDQVAEEQLGVVTPAFRSELAELAAEHPDKVFFADSRAHIGDFRGVMIKPNRREAACCLGLAGEESTTLEELAELGQQLAQRNRQPVFITLGADGMWVCSDRSADRVEGIALTGPLDFCGAGDSATAGLVAALCAGATPLEAAVVGNLVASITVQQVGTTGTATPGQVLQRYLDVYGEQ